MTELTTLDLVKYYFNICNTALVARDANPLVKVLSKAVSGRVITLGVLSDTGVLAGRYTTRFVGGRFTPVEEGERAADSEFTLSRSFLTQVVENSDDFIAHPERLDWGWLLPGHGASKS